MPDSEANTDELSVAPEPAADDTPSSKTPKQGATDRAEVTSKPQRLFAWKWIFPFEIAAWVGLVAGVIFLRSRGLRIDWVTVEYTVPPLIPVLAKSFLTGIALFTIYAWIRHGSPKAYLRQIASWRWLLLSLRLWLAVIVFTYTYFWLKVSVPLVNHRLWDEAFWNLDILVHLGFSPSLFLTDLFTRSGLMPFLDLWYSWWLPSVSFSIAFFCAFPQQRFRRQFMLSCVLIWTLGAWLYIALPALGPVYAYPEHWSEVTTQMPRADGAQHLLWDNYQTVIGGRTGPLKQFNPTRGIAAMPSLHVGAHWLLMLWFRRRARPFFVIAVLGTFLTFIASIATGWHYAVDGYVGIALGQIAYLASLRVDRSISKSVDKQTAEKEP